MAWRQKYTPIVYVRATRGWCLKYVDDAGAAPNRTPNADIAYSNESKAGRIRATTPPLNIWVVGYMSLVGQPGHVFFMKYKGNGVYEIRDSEVASGTRSPYTSINSILAWFSNYAPRYRGWSTHCDGRQYAESYTPTPTPVRKHTLYQGEKLLGGQKLFSKNGKYDARFQKDGNFVVHRGTKVLWASNTARKGGTFITLQKDGNLVIYIAWRKPVWATGTNGKGGYRLTMQDDGNLAMYTKSGKPVWATGTNGK